VQTQNGEAAGLVPAVLHSLSRATGEKQWRVTFGRFVYSSPAVVDGRAYVGSADGHLYCVR
jgi:outer membrane protein assembly factor BamB